jgi:hypothetical protein
MPTILDLLGLEYKSRHAGSSIFKANPKPPTLLYSQTIKSNAPANLCAIIDEEKFMIDRVMGHNLKMTTDEKQVTTLSNAELDYYQTLIFRMAKIRGLIV